MKVEGDCAVQCQVALVDAIHTHVLACGAVQPTGQDRTGGITVLQAADLVGQARVGIAIDLGLGVGDHIQQRLTRDPDLGKVVLYQLSYSRVTTCCPFGRNRTFDA